jgi:hypothetical protein
MTKEEAVNSLSDSIRKLIRKDELSKMYEAVPLSDFEKMQLKIFEKELEYHKSRIEREINKTEAKQPLPLFLADIFDSISKYNYIMNLLVEKQYCQPNTFIWKDEGAGNKGFLAAILKHLHAQGYYKDNKRLSNEQIKAIAKNTFGWEISIDTIKKAKPSQYNVLTFISPASTIE